MPGRVALFGRHLGTGQEVALEPDVPMPTGSAAKVLVLLAYAASGLDPAERLTVEEDDHRLGSGVLRYLRSGLQPTLDDLALLMIVVSDNVATDLLLTRLGGAEPVNEACAELGVDGAAVTSETVWAIPPDQFGTASPRGLCSAYEAIERAPADVRQRCLDVLARQQHVNGFHRHLPYSAHATDFGFTPPVRIWSKGGSYPGVQCEGALFETDAGRWVLAVMCDGLTDLRAGAAGPASTAIAEVARRVEAAWGGRI